MNWKSLFKSVGIAIGILLGMFLLLTIILLPAEFSETYKNILNGFCIFLLIGIFCFLVWVFYKPIKKHKTSHKLSYANKEVKKE